VELTESEAYDDKLIADSKLTPDNSVPNVIITCTADDDVQTVTDALHMIDTFRLPTRDEVLSAVCNLVRFYQIKSSCIYLRRHVTYRYVLNKTKRAI